MANLTLSSNGRSFEIDVLRVAAILGVITAHLWFFSSAIGQSWAYANLNLAWLSATCGLVLFFFLSGYSLMLKRPRFESRGDVWSFLFKRAKNIYPCYWLAFIIAYIGQAFFAQQLMTPGLVGLNISQWLAFTSGFHIMLYQSVVNDPGIFWFVGTIIVMYLLFPIMIRYSLRLKMQFSRALFVVSVALFIPILALAKGLNMLNMDSMVYFYWFFVAGMMSGHDQNASGIGSSRMWFVSVSASALLFLSIPYLDPASHGLPPYLVADLNATLVGIIAIGTGFPVARRIGGMIGNRGHKAITRIASSTYPIYLFHPYFLFAAMVLGGWFGDVFVPFFVLFLGLPLALFSAPYIQDGIDGLLIMGRTRMRGDTDPISEK